MENKEKSDKTTLGYIALVYFTTMLFYLATIITLLI